MKRVLVTGATGFIGRQSLLPLLEHGFEVHALYARKPIEADPRIIWHAADLLKKDCASNLCAAIRSSHLLHFAWYVDPKDYKTSPENSLWVKATLSLVQAFKENGGTRAVLAGSCMEYDWAIPQNAFAENSSPVAPTTVYGKAKNETRLLAEKYAYENDFSLAWGRIFFLYGPHEAPGRLVPYVINALLSDMPALCTSGEQIRDYSHVGDVGAAFAALLDSNVAGAVNIGSGHDMVLKDILFTIGDMLGKRDLIKLGARPTVKGEPPCIVADIRRLTDEVGWRPLITVEEGLRTTIDWWRKNKA
ncbi:MAG: NAD-dependent epimerase/dehydratase [Candidatus Kaiserbacteria bacterium GW2011_GWB1_52_6]|uniref:NAD-dependent epimerase/dehydratase n=2 Tax=Candidatus Kaiseribacteriota TaxID=1752734 RepID=A0A0G1XHU9_9BACT|nr:MAG: NAD-dependent epimerase/dehydratase [Candidatus Kaiserbacteria bacterium GW2011_GWB1_52_6]KKW30818.1 MAG: NAD-dependent epimerase/dehydratase [Candidatus Kaiserbacteria bacterium GW2011_GWC2_52_8b]